MKPSHRSEIFSEWDWNFDSVPDEELVACCYWEYARESAFVCDTLRDYHDWILKGGKWDDQTANLLARMEKLQSLGHSSDVFIRGCAFEKGSVWQSKDSQKTNYRHPEAPPLTGSFPAPWQSLSEAERKCRAHIRSHVEEFQIIPVKLAHWSWAKEIARECQHVTDEQNEQRKTWERKFLRKDEKGNFFTVADAPAVLEFEPPRPRTRWGAGGALMIDIAWDCFTNDEISSYFRHWVKRARPKEIPSPSDRGHKPKDWRAQLTRLAVLRLLARFTALGIIDPRQNKFPDVWKTKQFSGRKWGDVTKWHDARREARTTFQKLFRFVPKDELPLSWQRPTPAK